MKSITSSARTGDDTDICSSTRSTAGSVFELTSSKTITAPIRGDAPRKQDCPRGNKSKRWENNCLGKIGMKSINGTGITSATEKRRRWTCGEKNEEGARWAAL